MNRIGADLGTDPFELAAIIRKSLNSTSAEELPTLTSIALYFNRLLKVLRDRHEKRLILLPSLD